MSKGGKDVPLRYDANDYLYATARIRAMEGQLPTGELFSQLLLMRSVEEVRGALTSRGYLVAGLDDEASLSLLWEKALSGVLDMVKDPKTVAFLQYPTDCNNLKICIKCELRGTTSEGLLSAGGSLAPAALAATLAAGETDGIPPHMAAAIPQARTAFLQNGDAGEIDRMLDAACFADMWESTADVPFCRSLVTMLSDLANVRACLRLIRTGVGDVSRARLAGALVEGGSIPKDKFKAAFEGGESALSDLLYGTPYATLTAGDGIPTAGELERRADNLYLRAARQARRITFGIEVPVAYLVAWQMAIKNLRVLLIGMAAGESRDILRERMRDTYV